MKINKVQVTPSRWKKLKFDYKRASGHFLAYLANRFRWHYYPRLRYVSRFPDHVDVEISSACNMRCPMCYTTTKEFKLKIKREFMDINLFKKIIDECSYYKAYSIRLSLRGEPFIHKDVIEMIKYAKKKGIKEISSLTNNLALTPSLFKEIMDAGIDWITISFDGLGQTYERIRQPASFAESFAKIKEYKYIKDKARSCKPVIKIQTIWSAIKDCAKEYFDSFEPYVDDIAINPLIDYLHNDRDIVYLDNFVCPVIYQRLTIGSDGTVLLCSNDEFCLHPLGDTTKESIYSIWHGKKINEVRKIHKRRDGFKLLEPCKLCYLPRKTDPHREYIGRKEIIIDKYINRLEEIGK